MKVRVTRFECFHISRDKRFFFYLDLARDGTKEEKLARKDFTALLAQEKKQQKKHWYHQDVEGTGYMWRVEASIAHKYADMLDLSCSVVEELERYQKEGIHKPSEPIKVKRVSVYLPLDCEPHLVHLSFDEPHEQLRRALDQWLVGHWLHRDDWKQINTYGSDITVTRDMLQEFLDWFTFPRPFEEMLEDAIRQAREWEEQRRQAHEYAKQRYEQDRQSYQGYQPMYTRRLSALESALATFSLDRSVANLEIIKKRYRTLAKQYHPDTGGDEVKFKELNNANQVLMQHFS